LRHFWLCRKISSSTGILQTLLGYAAGPTTLATQCHLHSKPGHARDTVLNSIRDNRLRETVLVDFVPRAAPVAGELDARFDIVLNLRD
jgi:hypothetical protein